MSNRKTTIMRRVYTAFAARLIAHRVTLQASLFLVSLVAFAELVHVKKVVVNLFARDLTAMPEFILNALMRGEVLTLLALGVMLMTALSLQWQLVVPRLIAGRAAV